MTVSSTTNKNTYTGDDATLVYAYTFRILDETHILVQLEDANGTITDQTITTDYTVSGVGDSAGGNITFLVAPASTETVIFTRNVPIKQETDYQENDNFPAETHEEALDELTMIAQQLKESSDRTIKLPPSVSSSFNSQLTNPSGNASKVLRLASDELSIEYATITASDSITLPLGIVDGGTGGVTGEYTILEGAARTLDVQESTSGAGDSFTVAAGAALTSASDTAGGDLILSSGSSEGTGTSDIQLKAAKAGSTGSTTNTPQLAMEIKAEGFELSPHGTSAGETGEARFLELAANGANYAGVKAPDSIASSHIYELPAALPAGDRVLQSTSAGVLSWVAASGGGDSIVRYQPEDFSATESAIAPLTYLDGTNVDILVRAFDDTTEEYVNGKFVLGSGFPASGTITFYAYVMAATAAAAKNIGMTFGHLALGTGEDFDPVSPYTDVDSGAKSIDATQDNITRISWTLDVATSAWAASDLILFRLSRDPTVTSDLTGDMYLLGFIIELPT